MQDNIICEHEGSLQLNNQSLISVTTRAPPGHLVGSGVQVPVQPTLRELMHGIDPRPVSRLRGGLFCFKEVMCMWIIVGCIHCKAAKTAGCWRLYTASRHSFRSGRPGLFLEYGRMYESSHMTCVLLLPIVGIFLRRNEDIDLGVLRFLA